MISVTFKNVGQGDSIIIEWKSEDSTRKSAIIDCNLYNGTNPVLEHIIHERYQRIEYLILTHPHHDHFSGFLELLQYAKNNNIQIGCFLHTAEQVPTFLKSALKSKTATRDLQKLYLFLQENYEAMGFKFGSIAMEMLSPIPLSKEYSIEVLSPSRSEFNKYVQGAKYSFNEEGPHDNPHANWLSTVLKINTQNGYILLTSDTDKSSLIRIDKKHSATISGELLLGQSPHHGAKDNHNNVFWRKRKRDAQTPVVFSVGKNSYKHPAQIVVDFFNNNDYKIYSTGKVGGLSKLKDELASNALDMFSTLVSNNTSDLQGDKVFVFE